MRDHVESGACPDCGAARSVPAARGEWRAPTQFTAARPRRCEACGTIWEPATPRGLLVAGLVVGAIFLGLGILLGIGGTKTLHQAAVAAVIGLLALAGCGSRLRAPGARILRKGAS